ncbi:MAG: hypothetical protein AAF664_23790, partial [Planctomycetota bacterium]
MDAAVAPVAANLTSLTSRLSVKHSWMRTLTTDRSASIQSVCIQGVWGAIRGCLAASLSTDFDTILMVVPQAADADIVAGDAMAFGANEAVALPLSAADATSASVRDEDYAQRLQILQRLLARQPGDSQADSETGPLVVTAYIGGLLQPVPTPEKLASSTRQIAVDDEIDPDDLRSWMVEAGFENTTAVQLPGEFSARGGLLDIYSADQPQPIRIEFFGDTVESIRRFDPASQRSTETLESIELAVIGASESVHGEEDFEEATSPRPSQPSQKEACHDASVIDYLPDDTLVVVVDPDEVQSSASKLLARSGERVHLMDYADINDELAKFVGCHASTIPAVGFDAAQDHLIDLGTQSAEAFASSLEEAKAKLDA